MEINYGSQLGRFTGDKWARLWWVRGNKVSAVSLAFISTPLRFPHANKNTLTYFVSISRKGVFYKDNLLFTPALVFVSEFFFLRYANANLEIPQSSTPAWAFLQWCLCSTPHSECSTVKQETHITVKIFTKNYFLYRQNANGFLTLTNSKYSGFIFSPPSLTGMRMITAWLSGKMGADPAWSSLEGPPSATGGLTDSCLALGGLWQSATSALYTTKDQRWNRKLFS